VTAVVEPVESWRICFWFVTNRSYMHRAKRK